MAITKNAPLSNLLRQAILRDIAQCKDRFFYGVSDGYTPRACALGAMAIMHSYPETPLEDLTRDQVSNAVKTLPVNVYREMVPDENDYPTELQVLIVELNDNDDLSFGEIADKLEALGY